MASDPTPAQRRALAQIAALETEHEPANDERTSFEVEEIAVDLAEAMDEVRREPRTSLWRSFWDRLTEGGEAPGWPFEDDEPPHLVAPAPMGDRELAEERRAAAAARADLARAREALEEIASESGGHGLGAIAREALAAINGPGRNGRNEKGAIGTAGDEREALRDLAGRAARHLRTLPEQTEGRDVALAAELERAAAGSLAASPSPTAGEGRNTPAREEEARESWCVVDEDGHLVEEATDEAHARRLVSSYAVGVGARVRVQRRRTVTVTEWVDVPASRGDQDG